MPNLANALPRQLVSLSQLQSELVLPLLNLPKLSRLVDLLLHALLHQVVFKLGILASVVSDALRLGEVLVLKVLLKLRQRLILVAMGKIHHALHPLEQAVAHGLRLHVQLSLVNVRLFLFFFL